MNYQSQPVPNPMHAVHLFKGSYKAAMSSLFRTWLAIILVAICGAVGSACVTPFAGKLIGILLSIVIQHALLSSLTHSLQTRYDLDFSLAFRTFFKQLVHIFGIFCGVGIIVYGIVYAFEVGHTEVAMYSSHQIVSTWQVMAKIIAWIFITTMGLCLIGIYPYTLFLVMNRDMDCVTAFIESGKGIFNHLTAIIGLGLLFMVSALVATVPFFLGWFILLPINYHLFSFVGRAMFPESKISASAPSMKKMQYSDPAAIWTLQ